jgi:hypothetical protein
LILLETDHHTFSYIDYYGVTFDYLVPADEPDPEVLVINIIEVDNDGGEYADGGKYANEVLLFPVNPTEYTGKKVLAVPRCCQHKKGTQDRGRINGEVAERYGKTKVTPSIMSLKILRSGQEALSREDYSTTLIH